MRRQVIFHRLGRFQGKSTNPLHSGLAPYLGVAIAGRFIAGAGGAGMTDLISVIITGTSTTAYR